MTERQKLRRKRRIRRKIMGTAVFVLIIATLICAGCFIAQAFIKNRPTHTPTEQPTLPPTEAPTEPPTEPPTESPYMVQMMTADQIHEGTLILVNQDYEYVFPENEDLINAYSMRTRGKYKFSDDNFLLRIEMMTNLDRLLTAFCDDTGKHDVQIISCYRTLQRQTDKFNQKLKENNGDYDKTKMWVAIPGHSEHHTGFAVDMNIYTDEGHSEQLLNKGTYSYIYDNCYKYGIILRYPKEKTSITGIGNEPWHFRYVGMPHAEIATKNDLCWEEYIDFLREYPFDGEHLNFTAFDGVEYEIYFVAASAAGASTPVPVPKTGNYTVNGNNVDGYIVTCTK